MERLSRYWESFRDVAIVFSFAVNFVLVVLVLSTSVPAVRAAFSPKTDTV